MTNLVGFSGYLRSGKDTAAQVLVDRGWIHGSFAKALKDFLYAVNPLVPSFIEGVRVVDVVDAVGWEKAKDGYPEIRALLQRVGTDAGRKVLSENVWVDAAMGRLTAEPTVFTDVRFANEANAIKHNGGKVIRIERPGFEPGPEAHISETALDGYTFDHVIVNDGSLDDLHRAVLRLVLP